MATLRACLQAALERATYDSVAFRSIAANTHPDHDTTATFRKRFLKQLRPLFTQILMIAHHVGVFKLGNVSLDGTKVVVDRPNEATRDRVNGATKKWQKGG